MSLVLKILLGAVGALVAASVATGIVAASSPEDPAPRDTIVVDTVDSDARTPQGDRGVIQREKKQKDDRDDPREDQDDDIDTARVEPDDLDDEWISDDDGGGDDDTDDRTDDRTDDQTDD